MPEGLDFSRCTTLDCCLKRVEVVLMQADAVHNQKCITRKRAMAHLNEQKKGSMYTLTDDEKALIIANAVFPNHCVNFYALKMALNPNTFPYLDQDAKKSLAAALQARNHIPLIHFLGL